jgi:hypothetical protein
MRSTVQERCVSVMARAITLHAELATVRAIPRALLEQRRARRRASTYPLVRLISGGSGGDLSRLAAVIRGASLCLKCIETRTGVPLLEVETALRTMARTFKLVIAVGSCDSCRKTDATFSLTEPIN